jgi:copper chaperone CopZ
MKRFSSVLAAVGLLVFAAGAQAETKVKLTEMHICCGGCTKAIVAAVKDLTDSKTQVDQDNEEVTITAESPAAAQKAVDAIVAAGYHAKVAEGDVKIAASAAPEGKSTRVVVKGAHNCCGACTKSIQAAIKSVDGVAADTCKPKQSEFVVEGNFDAKALAAALNGAGFHVTVE